MDVNCGASPARIGEAPGCAGMVEMNMAQKNVANILLLCRRDPIDGYRERESRQ